MKIIIYDEAYWREIINFDALVEHGTINKEDMKLFDFCNSVDEAFSKIKIHFEKHFLNEKGNKKPRRSRGL